MTLGAPTSRDIGKIRGLQRITSADGMINACALDVLDMLGQMLAQLGRPTSHRDIVAVKHELISILSAEASAILTDAQYGLPAVAAGALDRSAGLIVTIEDEDYDVEPPLTGRRTVFRDGWSPADIRRAGGDVAKLLWFYRSDRNPETAEHQRQALRRVAEQCAAESLGLVVEPIWYALPDEDPTDPRWRAARVEGIVESLIEAEALGADLIKAEFPGYLDAEGGLEAARLTCENVSASLTVPWVILSAGVTFELFTSQVRIACEAGASGYLAGRAVWRDIVQAPLGLPHDVAVRLAVARVRELNAISREYGTPFVPTLPLQEAVESIPERWYAKDTVLA
jgi:tagatose 1,6-diphosphate aldolase